MFGLYAASALYGSEPKTSTGTKSTPKCWHPARWGPGSEMWNQELALILLDERHKPEDLVRAQHLVAEISARLNAAKVV